MLGGIGVFVLESHRGIPLPLVLTLLLFGISDYVLTQTKFGVHIYAVGGNIEAAKRAGINISRLKLTLFVIAGGISAIAGIMAASRALAVSQASGGGIGGGALLLQGIAAPVIGGISLFGGRGQVSGAFLGALIIGTVSNGLNLMGIASVLRLVVTGGLLISAVGIDKVSSGSLSPTVHYLHFHTKLQLDDGKLCIMSCHHPLPDTHGLEFVVSTPGIFYNSRVIIDYG